MGSDGSVDLTAVLYWMVGFAFRQNGALGRQLCPIYNGCMAQTKPFRLTESVKAAG